MAGSAVGTDLAGIDPSGGVAGVPYAGRASRGAQLGEAGGFARWTAKARGGTALKPALAILAAVLLIAGCGHNAPAHDPFVGTWHSVGGYPGTGIAISKVAGAYRVSFVTDFKPTPGGSLRGIRHGNDQLRARGKGINPVHPSDDTWLETFDYSPATALLTWTANGVEVAYSKVADSTAPPTPWPTTSPGGHSGPSQDPFVGTWHVVGYGPGMGIAISKVSSVYVETLVVHFKPNPVALTQFSRHGSNVLISLPGQTSYVEAITFNPANGRLTSSSTANGKAGLAPQAFTKVSDSTTPATPWPTPSP